MIHRWIPLFEEPEEGAIAELVVCPFCFPALDNADLIWWWGG